jgi:hypothetical protein
MMVVMNKMVVVVVVDQPCHHRVSASVATVAVMGRLEGVQFLFIMVHFFGDRFPSNQKWQGSCPNHGHHLDDDAAAGDE